MVLGSRSLVRYLSFIYCVDTCTEVYSLIGDVSFTDPSADIVQTFSCECGWHIGVNYCYWFSQDYNLTLSWSDAEQTCENKGGTLGIIYSDDEKDWITDALYCRRFHWMGFIWVGSEFNFIAGHKHDHILEKYASNSNNPNNCAGLEKNNQNNGIWWRDKDCAVLAYYMCIKPKSDFVYTDPYTEQTPEVVTTTAVQTTTTPLQTTQKEIRKVIPINEYKRTKIATAPISTNPTHVATGTCAIFILIAVVMFVVGNDITSLICKTTLCKPTKKRKRIEFNPKFLFKPSYSFRYNYHESTTGQDVVFSVTMKEYSSSANINSSSRNFDVDVFNNAYIVEKGKTLEVWVQHISIDLDQDEQTCESPSTTEEYEDTLTALTQRHPMCLSTNDSNMPSAICENEHSNGDVHFEQTSTNGIVMDFTEPEMTKFHDQSKVTSSLINVSTSTEMSNVQPTTKQMDDGTYTSNKSCESDTLSNNATKENIKNLQPEIQISKVASTKVINSGFTFNQLPIEESHGRSLVIPTTANYIGSSMSDVKPTTATYLGSTTAEKSEPIKANYIGSCSSQRKHGIFDMKAETYLKMKDNVQAQTSHSESQNASDNFSEQSVINNDIVITNLTEEDIPGDDGSLRILSSKGRESAESGFCDDLVYEK